MPATAMGKVFAIPELFESILQHSDLRDLLIAQRVSRHWNAFITTSPTLQETLFFKPSGNTQRAPRLNPLLVDLFPPLFTLRNLDWDGLNSDLLDFRDVDWLTDDGKRSKILRSDASWRRMLPVQPIAKLERIEIISIDGCVHGVYEYPCRLAGALEMLQKEGLRMGMLVELIAHMDGLHVGATFFVHWQMFALQPAVAREDAEDGYMDPEYIKDSESLELKNRIVLHHMSCSYCDGQPKGPSLLYMESPITSMLDEEPAGLLEFIEDAPTSKYYTGWHKFIAT